MYDLYEVDHKDSKGHTVGPEDEEPPTLATWIDTEVPTLESGDIYVYTSIMLPRGNNFARGRVIFRKRGADGNPTGRANANPILDTREYQVDFGDVEVSELTENVIVGSIYASRDKEGNEYIMMESLVDYCKNYKAISVAD